MPHRPMLETPRRVQDVREGGIWRPAQRLKNHAIYAAAWLALGGARRLSPSALSRAGRWLGSAAFFLAGGLRRLAIDNIARARVAGPTHDLDPARLAHLAYRNLGAHLAEVVGALDPSRAPLPPLPLGEPHASVLAEARRGGRGVLFASAHLGPWERVAATLAHIDQKFTTIARRSYDPRFTRLYEALRLRSGVQVVYRGDRGAATRLLRVLRGGGILGMPMDLRTRAPSIEVPFFGRAAATPVGPARLALRTGAAVVVGTPARGGDGALELTVTRLKTDDLSADAEGERALTERINAALEARIRALADHWVWMHARHDL